MGSADIRNGRRGHHEHDGSSSPHRLAPGASEMLSAEQAAPLLGCTVRHVRRLIASGDLAGHKDPYRTSHRAVDAYRRRAQPVEGDVVFAEQQAADMQMSACGQVGSGEPDESDTESSAVMVAIAAELQGARDQIERLARENGRLLAQLEQTGAACHSRRASDAQHSGPTTLHARALARLARWLLR